MPSIRFNVPNLVNLGVPNTVLSSVNGSSSQAGDPFITQLALKYGF